MMEDEDDSSSSSVDEPLKRDSVVSFASLNEDITDDEMAFEQTSAVVIEHIDHSTTSHDEGDDQLGPMEGDSRRQLSVEDRPTLTKRSAARRTSNTTCLSTGITGGRGRAHKALLRSERSHAPRSANYRRRRLWKKIFKNPLEGEEGAEGEASSRKHPDEEEDMANLSMHGRLAVSTRNNALEADVEQGPQQPTQYRLEAVKAKPEGLRCLKWLGISDGRYSIYEDSGAPPLRSCWGLTPNNIVVKYLHWTHRSSFMAVFLSLTVFFLVITISFALFIWGLGQAKPSCIGGVDFESDFFVDAYALSWTTFSTVGYGAIYSGISSEESDIQRCTGVTIIVTLEAFVGILFASMCGAILFAKVARIQSFAQVIFSDPIVIRYGSGVMVEADDASDDGSSSMDTDIVHIPCPILEFRIANRLNATIGGEIIDASVSIVASIDASQACPTVRNATRRRRRKKGKKGGPRQRASVRRTPLDHNELDDDENPEAISGHPLPPDLSQGKIERVASVESLQSLLQGNTGLGRSKTHQAFEEDPTGHLVPRRIFSKLEVESPDHPFFKRVWMIRHTLDQFSPLLQAHAREMVKNNNGYWPRELNSHEGIRAAVQFDQILVSMSGTSNADANSVYAQKVYDFVDVNVGYRFVNQLYREETDGSLRVDNTLINDVMEQAGGGGEPFTVEEGVKMSDMLVL